MTTIIVAMIVLALWITLTVVAATWIITRQ